MTVNGKSSSGNGIISLKRLVLYPMLFLTKSRNKTLLPEACNSMKLTTKTE